MFFANLRKQMRWIIIVIVIAFIGGTVYLGAGGVGQQATEAAAIAVVNGRSIPYSQFQQLYLNNVQTYRQFFGSIQGQAAEELMYMSLRNLIDSQLMYEAAEAANLPVHDSEIDEVLEELKESFPDDATFRQALTQSGLTERRLRELIRGDLKVQKLEEQVRAGAQISEEDTADLDEESVEAVRQAAEDEQVRLWLEQLRAEADIVINNAQMRAHHLVREGKLEEAVAEYELAMVEDPYNGYLHLSLGAVYEQLGRHEDAIAEYEKAVEMNEMDGELRIRLALAYMDAGRDEEATTTLREAGELNPWDANLQFSLMQLFTSLGLEEDAAAAGERLMEIQRAMLPEQPSSGETSPIDESGGGELGPEDVTGEESDENAEGAHPGEETN